MTTTKRLNVGDALRAYLGTKLNRPAVVLRVLSVQQVNYAFVCEGTSKPPRAHEVNFIFLDASSPEFGALGLTVPTWFKQGKTARIREDDSSISVVGTCPPNLLMRLLRLHGLSR